jgi:hypothetical protein
MIGIKNSNTIWGTRKEAAMVISARGGTILSEYTAIQRIKQIIDGDQAIKSEIDAKIKQIEAAASGFKYFLTPPPKATVRPQTSNLDVYTRAELSEEQKRRARELAVYAEYVENTAIGQRFHQLVDNALP